MKEQFPVSEWQSKKHCPSPSHRTGRSAGDQFFHAEQRQVQSRHPGEKGNMGVHHVRPASGDDAWWNFTKLSVRAVGGPRVMEISGQVAMYN